MQLLSKGQKNLILKEVGKVTWLHRIRAGLQHQQPKLWQGEGCRDAHCTHVPDAGFAIQVTGFNVTVCHDLFCLALPCATLKALPSSCAHRASTEQPCSWAGWKPDFCPLAVPVFLTPAVFGWWVILSTKGVRSTHRNIRNRHYTAELSKLPWVSGIFLKQESQASYLMHEVKLALNSFCTEALE